MHACILPAGFLQLPDRYNAGPAAFREYQQLVSGPQFTRGQNFISLLEARKVCPGCIIGTQGTALDIRLSGNSQHRRFIGNHGHGIDHDGLHFIHDLRFPGHGELPADFPELRGQDTVEFLWLGQDFFQFGDI